MTQMTEDVFTLHDESLGKDFKLHYNTQYIVNKLKELIELGTPDENGECDEYPIGDDGYGNVRTLEERATDIAKMQQLITLFESEDDKDKEHLSQTFDEFISNQAKKKNGSFAKNRVNDIERFDSFGSYWEDSYGSNTPALRVRSTGDYDCSLVVESYIVKY